MDILHVCNGITFEWDEKKAVLNLNKHNISFEKACEIFFDPFLLSLATEYIQGEERERVIGLTLDWKLLLVVYLLKQDTIRIISARPTTSTERKQYEIR
ncbi:MAG: BrnT family toxin [Crocosphaera sp.]|nr:BrnT family toxin [Crocosphaera sp.]